MVLAEVLEVRGQRPLEQLLGPRQVAEGLEHRGEVGAAGRDAGMVLAEVLEGRGQRPLEQVLGPRQVAEVLEHQGEVRAAGRDAGWSSPRFWRSEASARSSSSLARGRSPRSLSTKARLERLRRDAGMVLAEVLEVRGQRPLEQLLGPRQVAEVLEHQGEVGAAGRDARDGPRRGSGGPRPAPARAAPWPAAGRRAWNSRRCRPDRAASCARRPAIASAVPSEVEVGAVEVRTIGPVDPISGVDLDAAREVDAAVDEALGSCTMFIG
jgi:hypothetical protein